jgi:hypothetical protein
MGTFRDRPFLQRWGHGLLEDLAERHAERRAVPAYGQVCRARDGSEYTADIDVCRAHRVAGDRVAGESPKISDYTA